MSERISSGVPVDDQRMERSPDQKLGHCAGRVEAAGTLALVRRSRQERRSCTARRLVLEDTFVHGPELLHAEVGIGDRPSALRSSAGGQRQHGSTHDRIRDAHTVYVWRVRGRKEAAVEGRDGQVARATARVREARHRLQCLPQPPRVMTGAGRTPERLDGVGVAIDVIPGGDEVARLSEQQKEEPVDEGERVVEHGVARWTSWPPLAIECRHQGMERIEYAIAQRIADGEGMTIAAPHGVLESTGVVARFERRAMGDSPEDGCARAVSHNRSKLEVEGATGPRACGIDHSQCATGVNQSPTRACRATGSHGVAPCEFRVVTKARCPEHRKRPRAGSDHPHEARAVGFETQDVVAQQMDEGQGSQVQDRARTRRRAERGVDPAPPPHKSSMRCLIVRGGGLKLVEKNVLEKRARDERSADAR